jgi:hypothetical protein
MAFSIRFILVCLFLAAVPLVASAQTSSSTSTFTPSALSKGVHPLGSYDQGQFDSVSLYNGNNSITLPLVRMGGRDGLSVSVLLSYNSKLWQTKVKPLANVPNPGDTTFRNWVVFDEWDGEHRLAPGWRLMAGGLAARRSNFNPIDDSCTGSTPAWRRALTSLTRLTFTAPDGTEYDLVSIQMGRRLRATPPTQTSSNSPLSHSSDSIHQTRCLITRSTTLEEIQPQVWKPVTEHPKILDISHCLRARSTRRSIVTR